MLLQTKLDELKIDLKEAVSSYTQLCKTVDDIEIKIVEFGKIMDGNLSNSTRNVLQPFKLNLKSCFKDCLLSQLATYRIVKNLRHADSDAENVVHCIKTDQSTRWLEHEERTISHLQLLIAIYKHLNGWTNWSNRAVLAALSQDNNKPPDLTIHSPSFWINQYQRFVERSNAINDAKSKHLTEESELMKEKILRYLLRTRSELQRLYLCCVSLLHKLKLNKERLKLMNAAIDGTVSEDDFVERLRRLGDAVENEMVNAAGGSNFNFQTMEQKYQNWFRAWNSIHSKDDKEKNIQTEVESKPKKIKTGPTKKVGRHPKKQKKNTKGRRKRRRGKNRNALNNNQISTEIEPSKLEKSRHNLNNFLNNGMLNKIILAIIGGIHITRVQLNEVQKRNKNKELIRDYSAIPPFISEKHLGELIGQKIIENYPPVNNFSTDDLFNDLENESIELSSIEASDHHLFYYFGSDSLELLNSGLNKTETKIESSTADTRSQVNEKEILIILNPFLSRTFPKSKDNIVLESEKKPNLIEMAYRNGLCYFGNYSFDNLKHENFGTNLNTHVNDNARTVNTSKSCPDLSFDGYLTLLCGFKKHWINILNG
ncbi:hypothetical protein ACOME3_002951 [Neoechinorhynchus agilis]